MEQVLTRPTAAAPRPASLAERLLRCARIEEALAGALAAARPRSSDPAVPATLRKHAGQDEQHAERLRALAWEAAGDAARPDPDLTEWLGALSRAQGEVETLAGLYGVLKIVLADAYRDLIAATPEEDRALLPSLLEMLRDEEGALEWGWARLRQIAAAPEERVLADDWAEYLRRGLRAAGDIWGDMPRAALPDR